MKRACVFLFFAGVCGVLFAERRVWLDEMDLSLMTCGWERPRANLSVGGHPLRAGRRKFPRGVGTHACSAFAVETGGRALAFEADVAVDDEEINRGHGSVAFQVYADGRLAADTGVMKSRQPPKKIRADLSGARLVILLVTDGGDGNAFDHADWCDAFFTMEDGAVPRPAPVPAGRQLGILTPAAPAAPRINGPRVFGVRPGRPILFTLPVTGERPVALSASGLPPGAAFDPASGRLSGAVDKPGDYIITFTAENRAGSASRAFRLAVGDAIALTPPMGWNSWNCFAASVSDEKIRRAADAMKSSGLIDHGWSYINIDDYWQNAPGEKNDRTLMGPERLPGGAIACNRRFPDMKALADHVHALGLKIGIYSSPGPLTCGGCAGSWRHERQDAETYARWGFDYLKYDWCSYGRVGDDGTLKGLMRPYLVMSRALRAQNRDIVFSLCQYGMGHVSAWGAKAGGQCWRTTYDITDTWESMIGIADAQDGLEPFAGPGAWNDPDMLIVGTVGWGRPHPTRLTPNEQYTHMTLWCLFSAPLLIGCDMTRLDAFTLNLLTNDEVLEVDQDPLGRAARRVSRSAAGDVWVKELSGGGVAAGLINRSPMEGTVVFRLKDAGLSGAWRARDLWRQRDVGVLRGEYAAVLPGHAPLLLRLKKEE